MKLQIRKTRSLAAIIFGASIGLTGCGQQEPGASSFSDTSYAQVVNMALEQAPSTAGSPEAYYIWASSSEAVSSLEICMGTDVDCRGGRGQIVNAALKSNQNGRVLFRSDSPIALQQNLLLYANTGRQTGAVRVLRVVKIVPATSVVVGPQDTLVPLVQDGVAGDFKLKFGTTFNQKSTNWCWAYSSYHTLRTYYDTIPVGSSANADKWRAALAGLNTNQAFWDYMEKNIPEMQLGSPHQFVALIMRTHNLPADKKWSYENSDNRQAAVQHVEANLRKGIPSTYCRTGHCIMIYGFRSDGTKATDFLIADSIGGRFTSEPVSEVARKYSGLWTQPISNSNYRGGSEPASNVKYISDDYYDQFPASTGARN